MHELSFGTWLIHISSVIEWIFAIFVIYKISTYKKYDLFFIGHHEPEYEKYVSEVINKDISFFLGGPGWFSSNIPKSNISFNSFNEDIYPKIINQSSAGLGLYSSWNRNISSGRIFEIPATGAALIVKRNTFILQIFFFLMSQQQG